MERKKYLNYGIPRPVGYEQFLVTNVPAVLSPPPNATHALILIKNEAVRWRADAPPTAIEGIQLSAGDVIDWMTSDLDFQLILASIQFIRDNTGDPLSPAEIQVQYFG